MPLKTMKNVGQKMDEKKYPKWLLGFHVAEVFTGSPGKLVSLEDTIKGFKGIVNGEYDHLPEAAFYMVGTIEEAVQKAEKMAKDAAA